MTVNATASVAAPIRLGSLLIAPFRAVWGFLILLAEASPKMQELERLRHISDAELEERGLTRDGEIRRIIGSSASI